MTYSYVRAFVFSNLLMQIRKLINNVDKDPNIGRVVPPCSLLYGTSRQIFFGSMSVAKASPERCSGDGQLQAGPAGLRRQLRKNRGPVPQRPGSARAREGPEGRLCLAIVPDPAIPPAASHPDGGKRRGAAADTRGRRKSDPR